jgi:hypothetical protein
LCRPSDNEKNISNFSSTRNSEFFRVAVISLLKLLSNVKICVTESKFLTIVFHCKRNIHFDVKYPICFCRFDFSAMQLMYRPQ